MAKPVTPARAPAKAAAPPPPPRSAAPPPKTAPRPASPPPPRTAARPAAPPPPRAATRPSVPAEPRREPPREEPRGPRRDDPDEVRNAGREPNPQQQSRALTRPAAGGGALITQGFVDDLPSFMRGDVGVGKEGMSQEDLEIPRIKLIQGTSPELQEHNDLRAGDFYHAAADMVFNGPFLAVPLLMDRRYMLWRPLDSGGGILARADDGVHWSPADTDFEVTLDRKDGGARVIWRTAKTVKQSGLDAWGSMNPDDPKSPPAATLMYNYLLAFPEYPDVVPAVLTFQRSSIKAARKFNTRIRTIKAPIFGVVYQFASVTDTNSRGQDFFNIQATAYGRVTDQEVYEQYRAIHEAYSEKGMSIRDLESAQDEDVVDAEAEGVDPEGTPGY